MVLFILCIKAELDGVETLSLLRNTNLCFSVRNPLSDYEVREKIVFDPSETLEQEENDREPAHHFAVKWEGSKKYSTLIVLDEEGAKSALKKLNKKKKKGKGDSEIGVPRDMTSDDNGSYVPILLMECRGMEPYGFHPLGNEFKVVSEGGEVFEEDVDLSEGDWAEYDEENDAYTSSKKIPRQRRGRGRSPPRDGFVSKHKDDVISPIVAIPTNGKGNDMSKKGYQLSTSFTSIHF